MRRFLGLALATLALVLPARAQVDAELISVRSEQPGRTRLDVYLRVPHSGLTFTNVPSGFQARYNVTATLFSADRRGRPVGRVASRTWNRDVAATAYAVTRSNGMADRSYQAFDVPPGAYVVRLELEDEATHRTVTRQIVHTVRDLAAPVALSDAVLIDRYDEGGGTIVPHATGLVAMDEGGLQVYAEAYAAVPTRVRVSHEIVQGRRTIKGSSTVSTLRAGTSPLAVSLPLDGLDAGTYRVRVRLSTESGAALATADTEVELVPSASGPRDLDAAIAQLRYIARDREMRDMRSARSPEEKLERFQSFWRRLDPTPGTERNERQEEYYARVATANRRYTSVEQGWMTDRGGVLIQFGEPEHVDNRPNNQSVRPYEVWYYPRLGRRFVFIDRGGNQYQLLEPVWDERTRM
ncbi:MAG: GWxTD domain-containing protein [Rhodothermales bacterium]|nr:GWxTD domain-containing protein [Rhodothermales bacterium]